MCKEYLDTKNYYCHYLILKFKNKAENTNMSDTILKLIVNHHYPNTVV